MSDGNSETETRRTVLRKVGATAATATAGLSAIGTASAGDTDYAECVYSRSCADWEGENPFDDVDRYDLNQMCTESKSIDFAIYGSSCGVLTAMAAADPVPGNAVVVGIACSGAVLACALQKKLSMIHDQEVPAISVHVANRSVSENIDKGDVLLVPEDNDWWELW